MNSNFLKIAFRNLARHKVFAFINISGLAIGIACSILIFLYVSNERSFDRFHTKADRIHRLCIKASIGDTKINQTYSSAITFQKVLEDFPEVETGVKTATNEVLPITIGDKTFYEEQSIAVDSTFFNVFSFHLLAGNPNKVLSEPNSVVLTESTALKYFGTTDVVGRSLQTVFVDTGEQNLVVTGVSEDVPANSHFHYDLLLSLTSFPDFISETGWNNNNFVSYVLLKENASAKSLEAKLPEFSRKYMGEEDFDKWLAKGNSWEYFLQPLTSIHLYSDLNGEFEANGNGTYVQIFSAVSILVLLIAILNFVNMATARSSLRSREVGIKKVVGSGQGRLIMQFLIEAMITSFFSFALGLILVHLLLPAYSQLVGRSLHIPYLENPQIIVYLFGLMLAVGVLAGLYPALHLSSFKPITVLKSKTSDTRENSWLRNVLVVFQLSISIFLIISTIAVHQQLKFVQDTKLGFDKSQVLVVNNPDVLQGNTQTFKEELKRQAGVVQVSGANFLPGQSFSNLGFGADSVDNFTLNIGVCDYYYSDVLKLDLVKGRFFSPDFPSDSLGVVINEKAAKILGWKDPIGKKINNWGSRMTDFTIVGVVKDFHYESLHQEIRPMALFLDGGYYERVQRNIIVRVETEHIQDIVASIENKWKIFTGNTPFVYSFLDQDYDRLYASEGQTRKIFTIFSELSIFIACLGLLGLASFIAERKTKEISIRKVLGASVPGIFDLLNRSFVKWVIVASIITWPLAWYAMDLWLQSFAYHIDLSFMVMVVASAITMLITLAVSGSQTLKAALRNPVESLRCE